MMNVKNLSLAGCAALVVSVMTFGGSLQAPPGLFKDLNDEILDDAVILNGKQLFIDDYIIDQLSGARKTLNQPVKYRGNPILGVEDRLNLYGSTLYDKDEKIFKIWYEIWYEETKTSGLFYATSTDGIAWQMPVISKTSDRNLLLIPKEWGFVGGSGIFKDPVDRDPTRRYKMLYVARPDGTAKTLSTDAAYSPDGIHWTAEPANPVSPFSDTQICPYWDDRRGRYVAYLRYGPPNSRLITRVESEDFVSWSPKVTVIKRTNMDRPFDTKHYGMRIMPYEQVYIGILTAYYGETIQPIPKENEGWMDKTEAQLTFSRNGVTWMRAGKDGAIPHSDLSKERDWKDVTQQAAFIPYGQHQKDWDWGQIYAFQKPLIIDDEIWFYYAGTANRHWASYHGDTVKSGIGLARFRLDGFVSVDATGEGTLTTKALVFIGDQIEINADAVGGSIRVAALDTNGNVIEGFSAQDCEPVTSDNVHHVLQWNGNPDCHLIQARPIKLRFHLNKAKLYSFTPRIRHKHYVPSYD